MKSAACKPSELIGVLTVIGEGADDADLDAEARVPARKAVEDIYALARLEVVDCALVVHHVRVLVHGDVHGAPPDVVRSALLLRDALVAGRPPGLVAGEHCERARGRDGRALLVAQRVLVQHSHGRVVVYACGIDPRVVVERLEQLAQALELHLRAASSGRN